MLATCQIFTNIRPLNRYEENNVFKSVRPLSSIRNAGLPSADVSDNYPRRGMPWCVWRAVSCANSHGLRTTVIV